MTQTGEFNSYQFNVCMWDGKPAVLYFPIWAPSHIASLNRFQWNVRKYNTIPSTPPEPTQDPRFLFLPLAKVRTFAPPTRQFTQNPQTRKFTQNPPSRSFTYNPLPKVVKHVV